MQQPLFIQTPELTFAKVSADISLPKDATNWDHEVLQELYKAAPFVSEYEAKVVLSRVDPEKGYGFGHIELQPKTALTPTQLKTPIGASSGVKQVRVPIIIEMGKLKPLDIFLDNDSKAWPLNERRIRGALFRPQVFDTMGVPPKSKSTVTMLYPPVRDGYTMLGGGIGGSIMDKSAGVLTFVMPQALTEDVAAFENRLNDPKLAANYRSNKSTHPALRKIAETKRAERAPSYEASVLQIVKVGSSYELRSASTNSWMPVSRSTTREEICKTAGNEVANEVDASGAFTIPMGPSAEESPEQKEEVVTASTTGMYKVEDGRGRHLVGMLFSGLFDLNGQLLPVSLFSNGTSTAVQGSIAGVHIGPLSNPPTSRNPGGYGTFVIADGKGNLTAMLPMLVAGKSNRGILVQTFDGLKITIVQDPHVAKPSFVDGVCYIPQDASWMPLGTSEAESLASTPEDWRDDPPTEDSVTLEGSKDAGFRISGSPVDKVAFSERQALSPVETQFWLTALGADPRSMKMAMQRSLSEPVRVKVARKIYLPGERSQQKLANFRGVGALRRDLVKEASVIPDPLTVDAVLSLGFVTPENLMAYIGALPTFDEVSNHLSELLLAVRLGQRDIPVDALERASRNLEDVIEGLRTVAFAQSP